VTAFKEIRNHNPVLADKLENACKVARGYEGAKRLELAGSLFHKLTVEEAYQLIDPDTLLKEIAQAKVKKLELWYIFRNIAALFPLIWTWLTLAIASNSYQRDITNPKYPNDIYQPFLGLWQGGFHGSTWLTFSTAAIVDACLLGGYLLLVGILPLAERNLLAQAKTLATTLQQATDDLLHYIATQGPSPAFNDADIQQLAEAIGDAFERRLNKINFTAQQAVLNARDFVDKTKQQVETILTDFQDKMLVFNTDISMLSADLQTLNGKLADHDKRLQELTTASNQLATSSTNLVKSAEEMADNAKANTQASKEVAAATRDVAAAATGIAGELSALDNTQRQMINTLASTQQNVVSKIESTQQNVVSQIDATQQKVVNSIVNAADRMDEVAKDTQEVAKELGTITRADLVKIATAVSDTIADVNKKAKDESVALVRQVAQDLHNLTTKVDTTVDGLEKVNEQLKRAATELQKAANTVRKGPTSSRPWWKVW